MRVSDLEPVELLVCTTCKQEGSDLKGALPGEVLHERLVEAGLPKGVTLTPTQCLSNCTRGCSVVLRGGDRRWTYVYGHLSEDQADLVIDGAAKYAATENGLVPWRERSEHFRKNCMARIPPMERSEA